MKCLDTPLLLDLLEGRPRARCWLDRVKGEGELATTEVCLYELSSRVLRQRGTRPSRRRRLEALEALRRCLTVLPLDAEANRRACGLPLDSPRKGGPGPRGGRPAVEEGGLTRLVAGICLAHGVTELYTSRARAYPQGMSALRVVVV